MSTLPWLPFNTSRSLLEIPDGLIRHFAPGVSPRRSILATGRLDQYYANKPDLRASQEKAAKLLTERHCTVVGLKVGGGYWDTRSGSSCGAQGSGSHGSSTWTSPTVSASLGTYRVDDACVLLGDADNITHPLTGTR